MKTAQLLQDGQIQVVRLPEEYRFQGSSVLINKVGSCVVLMPEQDPWKPMFEAGRHFSHDFMATRDQGVQPDREDLDS